ncbi:potassium-transporting ATPase subunit KdpB [Salinisphaera sp. T31B1]|uniref:potassium-transporting ATPase subunit KdpB n=1 Tax=Salinisphaera sp. T31B1 TaxID=727963 RepID=UPI00334064E2
MSEDNQTIDAPDKPRGPVLDTRAVPSALVAALGMLDPRRMINNPVMFVTEIGAVLTTLYLIVALLGSGAAAGSAGYFAALTIALWGTVYLANVAEALAEARGKAQAASLRGARRNLTARRLPADGRLCDAGLAEQVAAPELRKGDRILVEAGETIAADGDVVEGIASVDESAITGESAPVIRESGGDRSAVTGGTRVLSDAIVVEVTTEPGQSFLDRMIGMVEGANRQKTPNEIALTIVLAGFTLMFLMVCIGLYPLAGYFDAVIDVPTLVALLVCLIPTTIGALLAAIGIAGMARLGARNVVAMSGRAVEAAGDADILLLDKTGTITFGNRQADAFVAMPGVVERDLAEAAELASLADETPEGRSIVSFARQRYGLEERTIESIGGRAIAFSAATRMSGVDLDGRPIRKGAASQITAWVNNQGGQVPGALDRTVRRVSEAGGTPLVVADHERVLGVIHLKDIVKPQIKERFAELRRMGVKTVMITGDNATTAAAIAAEAGVDDFLAEATPEAKLELIRDYQAKGHLVAMTGDGTNDAPALAQADVAVAMNTGTQAAKEAGNMVDLDSSPTKLISVVEVGKQMLMTRGSLTTFSVANDVAKYFAILPAIFVVALPQLGALNVMDLTSPRSAILSAVIFNALVIPALVPIALRGVAYRAVSADELLSRNLLIYGLGGLVAPFVGIKLIDVVLTMAGLA